MRTRPVRGSVSTQPVAPRARLTQPAVGIRVGWAPLVRYARGWLNPRESGELRRSWTPSYIVTAATTSSNGNTNATITSENPRSASCSAEASTM